MTALLTQYQEIKKKHPDAILLFRVGDFYETFSDDAIAASEILGITLTKRANEKVDSVELTGFPHHTLDTYLPKLVRAGKRVTICEQLEDPKLTKKLVKRGIAESNISALQPGQTRLPNGLIIGKKEKMGALSIHNINGRFMVKDNRVGIFLDEGNAQWYFAPLILLPEDEAKYKLYIELSWKYSEWIWIDEYGEDEELIEYYNELKNLYSYFVSKYGFLHSPENARFIKLDAYSHIIDEIEKEVIDKDRHKTYTPGEGFQEIKERIDEITEQINSINFTPLLLFLSLFIDSMILLSKIAEIRRKTAEIRAIARELKLSPKIAFNAFYEELLKSQQKSLFNNL